MEQVHFPVTHELQRDGNIVECEYHKDVYHHITRTVCYGFAVDDPVVQNPIGKQQTDDDEKTHGREINFAYRDFSREI